MRWEQGRIKTYTDQRSSCLSEDTGARNCGRGGGGGYEKKGKDDIVPGIALRYGQHRGGLSGGVTDGEQVSGMEGG